ncbi:Exo-beta-1,3-glucanase [Candidatus Terasakiella magnetica]|nr:Exo-beta-1,3-glucanase [Candidatus Terasakiella magnetica]
MNRVLPLAVVAVLAVATAFGWYWFNRPIPVELSFNEPFASVSFAPFRRGQSPLTRDYPPPAQIAEDLKSLVGLTKGVRTYTSLEGMDLVPEIAREVGIEVTHSAWLGVKLANNDLEVEALIKSANQYPDTIKRVIVGNEVLLRNDLTEDQLIGYIRKVKARVKQPVSYADVWAFWLKHPALAQEVDFITIHILPYWEDEPIGVDDAAPHIVKIYQRMSAEFPGKPFLIGEAGWPTSGRQRGPAVANMENGARFVRTLARVSRENGFDYNVVEAFDQPWKALLEGTVGANWGVVDAERRVKFAMSGPVEPDPFWARHAALSVTLGVAAALFLLRRPERYGVKGAVALVVLAQLCGLLVAVQAITALGLAYNRLDDSWAAARIIAHAALAVLILKAAAADFATDGTALRSRLGAWLVPMYGYAAVTASMLLLFHGRYRDIPPLEFLVPCLGVTGLALGRMLVHGRGWREAFAIDGLFGGTFPATRTMGIGLLLSVLAALLSEAVALGRGDDFVTSHPRFSDQLPLLIRSLWENQEILVWAAMLAVMAVPYLARCRKE